MPRANGRRPVPRMHSGQDPLHLVSMDPVSEGIARVQSFIPALRALNAEINDCAS